MTYQSAELVCRAYRAFANGDIATIRGVLAKDIAWHVPGRSPLSGDYHGPGQVLGLFTKTKELSNHTFKIAAEEMLVGQDWMAVVCTVTAERFGQCLSAPHVHLWRIRNDRAVEVREFQGDQENEDEFWSA